MPTRFAIVVLKHQNWLVEKVVESTRSRAQVNTRQNYPVLAHHIPQCLCFITLHLNHRDHQPTQTIFFPSLYVCSSLYTMDIFYL